MTQTEKDDYVSRYLPLVTPIARQVRRCLPRGFELEDLIAAGRLGLVLAASKYAPGLIQTTSKRAEAAFARLWITAAIRHAARGEQYRYVTMRQTYSEELGYVCGVGEKTNELTSTLLQNYQSFSASKSTA